MSEIHYLPLAYLNAWEYCPRRFYLEYLLGEMMENEHIIMGRYLHETINQEGQAWDGDTLIRRQQWVWHDGLKVHGIIDAVEERNQQLIPVEFKKGRMAEHLNDHFQLCAAALCLETVTGQTIDYGEIFYHGNRRRQRVIFSAQLREATQQAILAAHLTAQKGVMPPPISTAKKCRDCSVKGVCLPAEMKQLFQEVS